MKLAYFSPLNPQPSGISDYSEELLPYLAERAQLTIFVDGFRPSNHSLLSQFECIDYHRDGAPPEQLSAFDAVVYHVGNDHRYHTGIVQTIRRHPGIVVFHDLALQDFFLGLARERKDLRIYLDEMLACHGEKERRLAEEHLRRGSMPPHVAAPLSFPLNCRLAREAEGIITHSDWAKGRLQTIASGTPVRRVNMPVQTLDDEVSLNKAADSRTVSIASFGLITPGKGIEQVLRVLAQLRNEFDFRYTLVGADNPYFDVRALINEYGMADRVAITGHVSLAEFKRRIADTDIALNIRERTVGETSASLCRIMAAGVASIVADVGWYAELPDDSVIKIPLDQHSDALLEAFLRRLLADQEFRGRIGRNARQYMLTEHSMERAADGYFELIAEVIARRPKRSLVFAVSRELSALGVAASNESAMRSVAVELDAITAGVAPKLTSNGNRNSRPTKQVAVDAAPRDTGRLPKLPEVDYKRAAIEYLGKLNDERNHHLRTKPFYNLANKPAKYKGQGMDSDMHRHFCDFANMAVALALPPGARVLDVGCGSGWLSEYFARLGYEVKGIDISASLIEMSRERVARVPYGVDHETPLRCNFAVHDIEAAPLPEKFDAIICYDSLHHFEAERAVFQHLAAMLPIGGQLFLLEGQRPPAGSPSEQELREVMREFQTLESPFDGDYLHALLDANGFAVVGDYVSVNGLFEREQLEGDRLSVNPAALNYHYLICKKVSENGRGSLVPNSRLPNVLRAKFSLLGSVPSSAAPKQTIQIPIEIMNIGDTLWLAGKTAERGVVMPAVRVVDQHGTLVNEFHGEPPLPRAVAPGETIELTIDCAAPERAGRYKLTIDLVDQHISWFEQEGSQPLALEFEVS
jgi:2-polyprenyl-3-methyl-5-hydroxy-6-metoxy-1,4-benzoquinol methylase/glycosyltransferase involved in cell wall biosynthesis